MDTEEDPNNGAMNDIQEDAAEDEERKTHGSKGQVNWD